MSFLQPIFLLAALPLIALPIVIHLINQRRYQTARWAAMMFLMTANRMSRGYARVRQWLILSARMLAIAGLVFVIGRPLAGGWLGLTAGGRADTTIVILDRSPSMRQAGAGSGLSKLEAGRRQLAGTLKMLGPSRLLLIDGSSAKPRELESADTLLNLPETSPSAASADLPALLQTARDDLEANKAGETEIWIVSDLRENDWKAEDGRWQTVRDGFQPLAQRTRFHLLAYPQTAAENLAVRVTSVKRVETADAAELLISLRVAREGLADSRITVPVQIEIDGARSEVAFDLAGRDSELKDHRIALEKGHGRGWGKVSIPADANPADNAYWFAFDRPKPRLSVVVAENPELARPLQLAASISPDPAIACSSEMIGPEQLSAVEWETVGLLLWQAPLPDGEAARLVRSYLDRGGRVLFFPPKAPTDSEFLGTRWKAWVENPQGMPIEAWRGDQDLLAKTQSGSPLPVGQLEVRRYCGLEGESTPLATLKGGIPLFARVATRLGAAYFCATTASDGDSSLASGGIVLYVVIQRALADGAAIRETTQQIAAGDRLGDDALGWNRLAGPEGSSSIDPSTQPGVYAAGDRLLAVNRPLAEDLAPVLAAVRVSALFQGLNFSRVDDTADNAGSLVQEIWRLFLVAMMVALVVEAGLCLPRPGRSAGGRP